MPALITSSAVRSCLGDGPATWTALLAGMTGVGPLRHLDGDRLTVTRAYQIPMQGPETWFPASRWLTECVAEALDAARVDPARQRVAAVVGSGLRELRAVEKWSLGEGDVAPERLHFRSAVRAAAPGIAPVLTVSNACSGGGSALALAQDLLETGAADAVVAAGTDGMTESMLAMVGRVVDEPTEAVRPFDVDRTGVLLGEGAAAMVVVPDEPAAALPLGRLLATGLSCDAHHQTAPDIDGICRSMRDAYRRAGRSPAEVDLVIAHGTGTALNDPAEMAALGAVLGAVDPGPLITAVKGAVGHTSGGSALLGADLALRCLRTGLVPPVVGLRTPLPEARGLRLVTGTAVRAELRLVQVDAFGFGGVNAVTLLEAV